MNKQTETALKMAIEALEYYNGLRLDTGDDIYLEKDIKFCKDALLLANKEALEQPQCNPHPKAPHGFNRDASHSADRYVCYCEGWDAWEDGYDEGLRRGLEL